MSRKYKFHNPEGIYFISFAVVNWIDVFTRRDYKDIVVDSLQYCQKEKGLELFAWVIMTNHVHLLARAKEGHVLQDIIRDLKKYTSKQLITAIEENNQESRKEWMLNAFQFAASKNSNNKNYQFWRQDNKPIEVWSNNVIDQKLDYIHENPVEAGFVDHPEDYIYSSARNYAELKGLLEIELAV